MRAFKAKVEDTKLDEVIEIPWDGLAGELVTIQAVRYESDEPAKRLHLFDSEGDEFMFPFPGQAPEAVTSSPEIAVTVKLPLKYLCEAGGKAFIIWGKVHESLDKEE